MSLERTFEIEINGHSSNGKTYNHSNIKDIAYNDKKNAIYRANIDALTFFHSRLENTYDVIVDIDDLNTFLKPILKRNINESVMEDILYRLVPYVETFHEYGKNNKDFFSPEEQTIHQIYLKEYNRKRELYTRLIPRFEEYLQNKSEITSIAWEYSLLNPRDRPVSTLPRFTRNTRRLGGKSKKYRKSKKNRKSNKRK